MKKILTLCLGLMMGSSLFAQESQERLVIYDKANNVKGYLAEHIDSVMFRRIEGKVQADIKVLEVNEDKIKFTVTRTSDCPAFKFAVVPAIVANMLTSDVAIANYVDKNTGEIYQQDFTAGEIQTTDLKPGTDYVAFTVGIDQYYTLCGVSRAEFTTYKPKFTGDPTVKVTEVDVQKFEYTLKFTPSADVAGYAVLADKKGILEEQYKQMAPMFGFANIGDMVKGWGKKFDKEGSFTWKNMQPGEEQEVYILAWDKYGVNADHQIYNLRTLTHGGSGEAKVEIQLGDYKLSDWDGQQLYGQTIVYVPNDQTKKYRTVVTLKSQYDEDPAYWEEIVKQEAPEPNMANWWQYETFENEYQINPGVAAVALAAGLNNEEKWGSMNKVEFTPNAKNTVAIPYAPNATTSSTLKTRSTVLKTLSQEGKLPAVKWNKNLRLTGK